MTCCITLLVRDYLGPFAVGGAQFDDLKTQPEAVGAIARQSSAALSGMPRHREPGTIEFIHE